jgi:hypothetical protein
MRRRSPVILSAALAMALSVMPGLTPLAARAADTPDAAVNAVLDAIVAKQFDQVGSLVCEEKRDEVLAQFDLSASFSSGGVDAQPLVDSMTLSIDGRDVSVLSEEGDTASVEIAGTLKIAFDEAAAREWVKASLEAAGQPVDDATVDQFMGFLTSTMAEGTDISSTVEVVREGGQWLMCDDMSTEDPEASYDPNATPEPITNPLCDLLTVEELNGLSPLVFATATPTQDGCTYDSDYDASGEFFSLSLYLQEGELSFLKDVWGEGKDLTIAGKAAWGTETATWVDLGDGLLAIQPVLLGAGDSAALDLVTFAAAVGEIVVPRLP